VPEAGLTLRGPRLPSFPGCTVCVGLGYGRHHPQDLGLAENHPLHPTLLVPGQPTFVGPSVEGTDIPPGQLGRLPQIDGQAAEAEMVGYLIDTFLAGISGRAAGG